MTQQIPERAARGELIGRILNALNGCTLSIPEIASKTGIPAASTGAVVYRMLKDGRVREARREGRSAFFERVPAEERMIITARQAAAAGPAELFTKLKAEMDKAMLAVGELVAENGRLRAENDLLRRAHKDLAAKL